MQLESLKVGRQKIKQKNISEEIMEGLAWCSILVIPATQESEVGDLKAQGQPGQHNVMSYFFNEKKK